jgi:predicted ArsR family transcriptional regulator
MEFCKMSVDQKCGPENCPIITFSDLTPAEQRNRQKQIIEQMWQRGFSQKHIAKHLGIGQAAVSRALAALSTMDNASQPRTDSLGRRASTGRPRGRRAPAPHYREAEIAAGLDEGLTDAEIAATTSVGRRQVRHVVERIQARREGATEAAINIEDLPQTYKDKYAVVLRKFEREKAETVRQLVNEQVKKWHKEYWLPHHTKLIKDAERVLNARRNGVMPKSTYKKILRCLHSDTRNNISERWLNEAFQEFKDLERILVKDETPPPSMVDDLPSSMAEWDARRQQATEERRSRRMQRR